LIVKDISLLLINDIMIKLIYKLVLPLTFISFFVVQKRWVAETGGPPDVMHGFPFIYHVYSSNAEVADHWKTSNRVRFYILEFILDLFVHFLFWYIIIYIIYRFFWPAMVNFRSLSLGKISIYRVATTLITGFAIILILTSLPSSIIFTKVKFSTFRTHDVYIKHSEYKLRWMKPEIYNYRNNTKAEKPIYNLEFNQK
jgi:hypothetical protein